MKWDIYGNKPSKSDLFYVKTFNIEKVCLDCKLKFRAKSSRSIRCEHCQRKHKLEMYKKYQKDRRTLKGCYHFEMSEEEWMEKYGNKMREKSLSYHR